MTGYEQLRIRAHGLITVLGSLVIRTSELSESASEENIHAVTAAANNLRWAVEDIIDINKRIQELSLVCLEQHEKAQGWTTPYEGDRNPDAALSDSKCVEAAHEAERWDV